MGEPWQPGGNSPRFFSRKNMVSPRWRLPGGASEVRAMMIMKSAPSANVHQYLLPLISQLAPSFLARQEMVEMSEPALGSDIEKAPRNSPLAMRERYRPFCSSLII